MTNLGFRAMTIGDAADMAQVYAHHVLHGTASFEELPPSADEMAQRLRALLERDYPGIVAVSDHRVIGYAYAGPHKERSAYRYTVEDSIYLAPTFHGKGVGGALMSQLIEQCQARGFGQMMAVIGDSENNASIALHRRQGFRDIGIARGIGLKFGRTLDVVYMQRDLRD